MKISGVVLVLAIAVLASGGSAFGAQLIDRNATQLKLAVNQKGEALLTYQAAGKLKHVLVWGAVDALQPLQGEHQVAFKLDYSGGYGKYHKVYWLTFKNQCLKYSGPVLPNVIAECKAPDGSFWAVQQWPQPLPDLGFTPWTPQLRAQWLEVSHWTSDVAKLTAYTDWVYGGRFQQVFGQMTYRGNPVYGFGTTNVGAPTDGFGRLIYLDTHNSIYGSGWRRENSFVPHNPTGVYCYGFYPFDPTRGGYQHPPGQTAMRGPGTGDLYRLTASGPGVTPNVAIAVKALHPYDATNEDDASYQDAQAALLQSYGDKSCMAGLFSP
ncbi:MAG: hypothetical protein ACYDCH_09700 [Gaiellaceae bacterium]